MDMIIGQKKAEGSKSIGFIGPGKVGCSLGRHIAEKGGDGFQVCGYFGRDPAATREAAAFAGGRAFDTAEGLAAECDLLLLTVPDKEIENVWASLAERLLPGRDGLLYVGHCCGSQGADTFCPKPGCHFGSMHPLIAVHDKKNSYKIFDGAYFTIEGGEDFKAFAGNLLTSLGNPFCAIEAEQKAQYHAASVMVSNLVCALAYTGMETFKACGLDDGFADKAWRSLFLENAENTASFGPVSALTGPVERGDAATVALHLGSLSGEAREIYLLLSRTLTEIARIKNPGRDYSDILKLLGDTK